MWCKNLGQRELRNPKFDISIYVMNTDLFNRITSNPRQCGGRPCIRGMRIRVKDVLDMLAGGATTAEILQDYPYLEAADIQACLAYASAQIDHAVVMVES